MPNQFLSDEFGDIEDYFVTDYWLIDNFVGDSLWTWGSNSYGKLGTNDGTQRNTPVTTFAGGMNWKQISAGREHTAAIKTDGTLWTWGFNGTGQLGTSDGTQRNTPVTTFAGGNNWKQVSCGFFHTAAIKTDGSLWIWGNGNTGRLGTGNTTERNIPVTTFAGGNTWKSVSCGWEHTAAIKTDGSLWTWGRNSEGQLGDSTTTERQIPVTTFIGGNTWKQVSAGSVHVSAIKTDGTLWVWGTNSDGRLGINNITNPIPTPVTTFAGGTNWKSVNCSDHSAAIKTDGSLWTWGPGTSGQLGNNAITDRSTPVIIFASGKNWKQVDCGENYTTAVKTDGSLWTWGASLNGKLGVTGDTPNRSTPVTTFAGGNNWKSVSGGSQHTAAIKSGLNVDLSFFPVGFVSDGLALYLDAGDLASYNPSTSGTTWTDLSGNGRTGTLTNMDGTNFNSSLGLGSLSFNGSDEFVQCAGSSIVTEEATFIVWMYRGVFADQYDGILFSRGANTTGIHFQNGGLLAYTWNDASDTYNWGSNLTIPTNEWAMCAVSVRRSAATAYLCKASGITNSTNTVTHTIPTTLDDIKVGKDDGNESRYYAGSIAQALIYNRALSATEIQQNFNFSKSRFGL